MLNFVNSLLVTMELIISLDSLSPLDCPFFLFILKMCVCVSMCVCVYTPHMCRFPWNPKEEFRSSGAWVTGGFEPPDVGSGNGTLLLLLSHLPSPTSPLQSRSLSTQLSSHWPWSFGTWILEKQIQTIVLTSPDSIRAFLCHFKIFYFIFLHLNVHVLVFACVYICAPHVHTWCPWGSKRGLELEMVVSHWVCAQSNLCPWESSLCF